MLKPIVAFRVENCQYRLSYGIYFLSVAYGKPTLHMQQVPLRAELIRRISGKGMVTFAEFMELALYWPNGGYYVSRSTSVGDYFTSPMAHPVFGALVALQLEEMWRRLDCPRPFAVIEQGAGSTQLARDVESYASHLDPSFADSLFYVAGDRSFHSSDDVVNRILTDRLPFQRVTGCVLSNELIDAMPVHRVVVEQGQLYEVYVEYKDGNFSEVLADPSVGAIEERLTDEGIILKDGQRAEVCLALESWIQDVSQALDRGFVLSVDYGHVAEDLYAASRNRGTLRCYYKHTLSANPYVRVGEQDITAHVDFTALSELGKRSGLSAQTLVTQRAFLQNLGIREFQQRLINSGLGQNERDANRMAMLELARSGGLGDFKVLVQSKNIDTAALTGFSEASLGWKERLMTLPLPRLGSDHLSLLNARYPYSYHDYQQEQI